MTQIKQFWKNTHDVKPQEGRDLLIVRKRERTYYQFGLYNSSNDRVMITSPTGFPWQSFEDFDMWAYLDELLDISNQQEPANEQTLANSAKSSEEQQEYINYCWKNWVDSDNNPIAEGVLTKGEFEFYARHFAHWQKEQDEKELQTAEEHGILSGMNMEREKLMKDAVEIKINRDTLYDLKPLIHERYLDYKIGQKVKIIILPSDEK
jgi:hypothetical protein